MRDSAPAYPIPARMIKVPYPTYGHPVRLNLLNSWSLYQLPNFQRSDASRI
ncbi:hypothetical protein MTR_3g074920 [Medicago truncatula]|uniref:Uncharacterized protein n=1 Tax=Medicago truncatula TaxID=3880 RepID=A0A072UZU8_MEDTR|nr:hypothetical protein MTR_3g074920 [Medicago truncatula]